MAALRDGTRRFWASLALFLFGPGLLGVVGYSLYWRTTDAALEREASAISAATRFDVSPAKREFLRPGVRREVGVEIASPTTNEPAIFCPEIYFLRLKDADALLAFARAFDDESRRTDADVEDVDVERASENARNAESFDFDAPAPFAETLFSDDGEPVAELGANAYWLAVAPTVYCRDSRTSDVRATFCDAVFRTVGTDAFAKRGRVLCVVADRVLFQTDADFERTRREFEPPTAVRSTRELKESFRTAATRPAPERADATDSTTNREVIAFVSEEPTLAGLRALVVDAPKFKRAAALFELRKIAAARPVFVSFETRRETGTRRFEFDSLDSPVPSAFLGRFSPLFRSLNEDSWSTGRFVASTAPGFVDDAFALSDDSQNSKTPAKSAYSPLNGSNSPSSPSSNSAAFEPTSELAAETLESNADGDWSTRLENFRLRRWNVETITRFFPSQAFSGFVSELSLERGATRRGVFVGSGSIEMRNGTLPYSFLKRLCDAGRLEVLPNEALSYRFPGDATPFTEFELRFDLRPDGVSFDSRFPNKIIACYRREDSKYGVFLPRNAAGVVVPYSDPLLSLFERGDARAFWSPLYRAALQRLPVAPPAKSLRSNESDSPADATSPLKSLKTFESNRSNESNAPTPPSDSPASAAPNAVRPELPNAARFAD